MADVAENMMASVPLLAQPNQWSHSYSANKATTGSPRIARRAANRMSDATPAILSRTRARRISAARTST